MNKSLIINLIALFLIILGFMLNDSLLQTVGLFALSGAITNWLAIHMLFEKVPGLYGSGVVPARFEDFKLGIRSLMMNQFFTEENVDRFLRSQQGTSPDLHLAPVIQKINLDPAFDSLIKTIMESSFGSMLGMLGGENALKPLREPFIQNMKNTLTEMTQTEAFLSLLREELEQPDVMSDIRLKVADIIEKRLNELTPQLVKQIVQDMIQVHLGWLVVWGGVFGGVIGLVASLITN